MKPSDMQGKSALITGAAAGLGRATALQLAAAGADVYLLDIDAEGLAATVRDAEALGVRAIGTPLDLADPEGCRGAVDAAVAAFGRLDALCNIAALFLPCHTEEMSLEAWDKTVAVNLRAPFLLIQAALPQLVANKGAVVNVTSCAAHQGQSYLAAYSATKAGLTQMTKSLAMEYIQKGVRFNVVAPGGMMTKLAAGFRTLQNPDATLLQRYSPMRGLVEVDQVAELVAFLATDAASGYHGAVINLDNGITAG